MPRQPYREAVKSDRRSGYILSLLRRAEAWRGMWSSLWLKGDGGIRKNILFFSKAFSKHFPLLIPLHHDLSLFLPGKLHLSFLAILRKELQQRPVLFKLIEQFGEITSRLARRRKRNLPTNLIIHSITLTTSIKTNDRKIIGNSFQNDMRSTLSNTGKEEYIRFFIKSPEKISGWIAKAPFPVSS